MNYLEKAFQKGSCITIYLTMGYPNWKGFFQCLELVVKGGMDVLELGIPVSNPCLDGETIAHTHREVIRQGFDRKLLLSYLQEIKKRYPLLPVVVMSYQEGVDKYNLLETPMDFDGLLSPDTYLQIESSNFAMIQIYHEDMGQSAIAERLLYNQGFAYVMSGKGKTGETGQLSTGYLSTIKKIRQLSNIPIQVGFGISSPSQITTVLRQQGVNGVIIGSHVLRQIDKDDKALWEYVRQIGYARAAAAKVSGF